MNFEKPEKSDFSKNEKKQKNWRYYHFTHVYQKPQLYEVQFLRYRVRQNLLLFWAIFCPFTPHLLTIQKIKNFEKMKKPSADVIILKLSNNKHDHVMYACSDMECDRHNFLSF